MPNDENKSDGRDKGRARERWNAQMNERLNGAVSRSDVAATLDVFATVLEYWGANLREDVFDYFADTQFGAK